MQGMGRNTGLALLCVLGSFGVTTPALATTTVTQITYDAGNHVASITDPRGLVTTYTHDGMGQLWQQVSPDTGTTTYNYDGYGRRSSLTRADNTQTTYGYDGLNRTTSVTAGGQTQTFTYDTCTHGVGRLCSAADATGATSYSYSPEGWLTGRGFSISGTTYSLGYGYNALGQVASVVYPDGNQANYSYTQGVVSGITLNVGGTNVTGASAITYQPMNAGMSSWTSSNGLVNTLNYDTDGRLTGISSGSVQSLGFSYDAANRIVGITNGIDGSMSQNFGYDDESRLVSVYSGADIESYQYDLNGNRTSQVVNGTSTPDTVSTTSNQLASFGAQSYGYDAKGNTTTVAGAATYHYDAFNRMDSAGGMAYYVNPEGQRLRKSGAAGTSYFAPDRSGTMLAEYSSGGWIDYVWLNGRLIGRVAGGQRYAIHDDQTGRPEAVTDGSGAVVWRAQNFAFTQNVTTASIVLNLGFPGQYYDAETSAWNNGFRDYKSALGRYVESDPMGLGGGVNTYAYVGGNPLSRIDPYGMFWMPGDTLPQGLVDGITGFGDGVFSALTFGQFNLQDTRDALNISGGVDKCSASYDVSLGIGELWGSGVYAVGGGAALSQIAGAQTTAQSLYLGLQVATGSVDVSTYSAGGISFAEQLSSYTALVQDAANESGLARYIPKITR